MLAYAQSHAPPDPHTEVPNSSCSGQINLRNAAAGVDYRGRTLAYGRDIGNKPRYRPGMVVRRGEVLVNDNVSGPGGDDRSHIVRAVETGTNPRVISTDHRLGGVRPGTNVHLLDYSHRLFGYEWVGHVPGLEPS